MANTALLVVAASKAVVPPHLNGAIVQVCNESIQARGSFTVALSGGSLPSFLGTMKEAFASAGVDPQFGKWHIILADERCVPITDADSNLGEIKEKFLAHVSEIPASQVYGINEAKLQESADAVATDYEKVLSKVLEHSGGKLDCAVLGFGPDGHTCSLFPDHPLLLSTRPVASIEDSPKPPPKRITLTFPVLNTKTRHVIFCGAGASKSPILQKVFASVVKKEDGAEYSIADGVRYTATLASPPPYPCAMVVPQTEDEEKNTLTWIVDADAMKDVAVA